MSRLRIVIAGGGAAGFFAGIAAANADPQAEVTVLEKGPHFLAKVRISGGGRCNVTHACFDPRALSRALPARRPGTHRTVPPVSARATPWRGSRRTGCGSRPSPTGACSRSLIPRRRSLIASVRAAGRAGVRLFTGRGVESARPRRRGLRAHAQRRPDAARRPASARHRRLPRARGRRTRRIARAHARAAGAVAVHLSCRDALAARARRGER